VRRRNGN